MTPALRLATAATLVAAVVVPLLYLPMLEAPFVVPKFAVLELAAALGLVAFVYQRGMPTGIHWARPVTLGAALVLVTTVLAWAMALPGPLGTSYAVPALARWGALFGLAAGTTLVAADPTARGRLLDAVTAAAAAVSVIGLFQHLELVALPIPVISAPGSTFGNRNLAAEAVALSLPLGCAAIAAARGAARRVLLGALTVSLVYLAATRARGAWLGAGLGLITTLALIRPRLDRRALAVGGAVLTLALLAGILPGRLNPRYVGDSKRFASGADVVHSSFDPRSTALRTRLGIWRRGLVLWREHPLWGVGPGNWPVAFPRYAEPDATRDGVMSAWLMPRQAHDDLVERAAETGLVGLAALGVLVAGVALAARRRLRVAAATAERLPLAGAAGALVALLGTGLTGFPLEMPATIALGGLALGLVAGTAEEQGDMWPWSSARTAPEWVGQATIGLALLALLAAGLRGGHQIRASLWLGRAEHDLHRVAGPAGAERALPSLARAAAITPGGYRIHLRTAQMMLRLRRFPEAEAGARRALAVEPLAPNAWATVGAAELGAGRPAQARTSAGRALELLHDHAFALFVDAQSAEALGDRNGADTSWKHLEQIATSAGVDEDTANAAREFLRSRSRERR
jgi:O-antigen ligase